MCEKEIIKCAEFLGNREDETTVKIDNDFYDERDIWKGLLDLYNKEKEKNIIFKRSTIITDIKRHGIEINMSADRLVNEYLLEKIKNSELEELLENSISKDKIIDLLDKYKNEHFIAKVDLKSILEDNV